MGILNLEEYKRRLESGNPVTIEEFENELKVLIKEMIETATQGELTTHYNTPRKTTEKIMIK